MQTGQLLSSMMNRVASTSAKPIDLTPGQVFKGTVTRLYPDNLALVQIGGVQIQAKLEANLEVGQKAWLQVQPTSNPVTLKVLTTPENPHQLQDTSTEGLMRSLGLSDTPESKALVESLVKQNLPVNKETVNAFLEITKTQGSSKEVVDAFLLAMKRNLPLTNDVVGSLRTFLSGKPLADTIQQFLQEAKAFLQSEDHAPLAQTKAGGSSSSDSANLRQLLTRAVERIASLPIQLTRQETVATPGAQGNASISQQQAQASGQGSAQPANLATNQSTNQATQTPVSVPSSPSVSATSQSAAMGGNQALGTTISTPPLTTPSAIGSKGNQIVDSELTNHPSGGTQGANPSLEKPIITNPNTSQFVRFPNSPSSAQLNPVPNQPGSMQQEPAAQQPGTVNPSSERAVANGLGNQTTALTQQTNSAQAVPVQSPGTATGTQVRNDGASQPVIQTHSEQQGVQNQPIQQTSIMPSNQAGSERLQNNQFMPKPVTSTNVQGVQGETNPVAVAQKVEITNAGPESAAISTGSASSEDQPPLLKELFQKLGLSHERQVAVSRVGGGEPASTQTQLDNVKSMLMQISQSASQLPEGLKSAADSLLQQVTGQQLLLSQPSHQAISQVVMQIPLRTENGDQTAFVQIESRKRDGGQLDAENCRLFFNLDLQSLGITMVDVNIVNKIVNINIFNNMPWVETLVTQARDMVSAQLRETGYQLSHLKTQPIPVSKSMTSPGVSNTQLGSSYKGVDLRV